MVIRRSARRRPARLPSLDPSKIQNSFTQIEGTFRDLIGRVSVIEAAQGRAGGGTRTSTIASGESIQPGKLIHVTDNGQAYLATAANADRYCTDVAVSVEGSKVQSVSAGEVEMFKTPDTTGEESPKLFLATLKGYSTANPDESGAVIQQEIGFRRSAIGGVGKCEACAKIEQYIIL